MDIVVSKASFTLTVISSNCFALPIKIETNYLFLFFIYTCIVQRSTICEWLTLVDKFIKKMGAVGATTVTS